MSVWQLQEAKSKFSRVVEEALADGPQFVTKRGVESVVIISSEEYKELTKPKSSLLDVLRSAPKAHLELDRSKEAIREIEF